MARTSPQVQMASRTALAALDACSGSRGVRHEVHHAGVFACVLRAPFAKRFTVKRAQLRDGRCCTGPQRGASALSVWHLHDNEFPQRPQQARTASRRLYRAAPQIRC
jgi:hypothetical protein